MRDLNLAHLEHAPTTVNFTIRSKLDSDCMHSVSASQGGQVLYHQLASSEFLFFKLPRELDRCVDENVKTAVPT